jgi:hypothetical protein
METPAERLAVALNESSFIGRVNVNRAVAARIR